MGKRLYGKSMVWVKYIVRLVLASYDVEGRAGAVEAERAGGKAVGTDLATAEDSR